MGLFQLIANIMDTFYLFYNSAQSIISQKYGHIIKSMELKLFHMILDRLNNFLILIILIPSVLIIHLIKFNFKSNNTNLIFFEYFDNKLLNIKL